jgi:uncharacterized membrane protein YbaN (DUF454 family)
MRSESLAENLTSDVDAPRTEIASPAVDVRLTGSIGSVRIRDAQLFNPARREFNRKFAEHLCKSSGVTKAEIDWNDLICEVDFDLTKRNGSNPLDFMAGIVVRSVRSAASEPPNRRGRPDRGTANDRRSILAAYPSSNSHVSIWEADVDEPDRVELRHTGAADRRVSRSLLEKKIALIAGVKRCKIARFSRRIEIDRSNGAPETSLLIESIERIIQGRDVERVREADPERDTPAETDSNAVAVNPGGNAQPLNPPIEPARGLKKWKYLALAGGSFMLSIVGLIVPGVPTVPFLLATSYYLARSSPKLNERLLHARFFGSILRDWETRSALSPRSKLKLVGLTLAVVTVTILFLPITPVAFVLIAIMATLSVVGVARTPTILDESPSSSEISAEKRTLPKDFDGSRAPIAAIN